MAAPMFTLVFLFVAIRLGKVAGDDPEVCFDTLDNECFKYDVPPFRHDEYRPFSPAPLNPLEMNNTFTVFKFHGYGKDITEEKIDRNHLGEWKRFHSDNQVAVIVHDFLDHPEDGPFGQHWVFRLKDILLQDTTYTVIVVDWKRGSGFPYSQAVANARVVSAELFHLIQSLQSVHAMELENFHLIGHGIGAHIAGMTGQRFPNRIGRITGLDPSGRFYEYVDEQLRLGIDDALFVDVIHTNDQKSAFGSSQTAGHYDFYPMAGRAQPGCKEERAMYLERQKKLNETMKLNERSYANDDDSYLPEARADTDTREIKEGDYRILNSCDHRRAVKYFMESIVTECEFKGEVHRKWIDFEKQVIKLNNSYHCDSVDNRCARMGFFAEQYRWLKQDKSIKVYLRISGMPPFCVPYN